LEIAYLFPYSAALDTIPDVPKVTPSFCGTLLLADLGSGHLILKALAALPLRFTTISIQGCTFHEPDVYQMLLTSCRETLVTLRFEKSYRGVLGVCPGLIQRVLTFYTSRSAGSRRLVSFLRQTRGVPRAPSQHQKTPPIPYGRLVVDNLSKTSKDILLSRLAQQVRNIENKLTLQLKIRRLGPEPLKFDHLVPKFLGHGGLVDINYGDGPTPTV
jgi:hypothetical protein